MADMGIMRQRPTFAAAPYALVDDETISPQAKAVYLVLDRHAGYADGATFVGKDLVARKCGYSKADSVDRYLNELRGKGWLTWRRRWRRDTGQRDAAGRPVYEYAYAPGKGFEPTTNLYVVHDRVAAPVAAGEPVPAAGGTPVPAARGTPVPATRGTNENQVNENQVNNPPSPPRGADGARAAEGGQQPLLPGIPEGQAPTGHQPPAPQPVGQPDLQAEFERWWATCPRKIGKGRWPEGNRKGTGARAAFIRAREQASLQQLLDGMARSVAAWKAEGRAADKLPHPSTWLNQARWEDEGAGEWQQQAPQPRNTNTLAAWLGTDTAPQVGQQGHQPGPVIEHNEGNTPWL